MVSKVQPAETGYLDLVDEKTPTSVYMPQFDSDMRMLARPKSAEPAWRTGPETTLSEARFSVGFNEPSIIISPEIMGDYGCDGVADTVAIVRRRRWNAFGLALIAGLSGLFAVSLGILLADFAGSRCNMLRNEDPQSSEQGASVTQVQYRSNSAYP